MCQQILTTSSILTLNLRLLSGKFGLLSYSFFNKKIHLLSYGYCESKQMCECRLAQHLDRPGSSAEECRLNSGGWKIN